MYCTTASRLLYPREKVSKSHEPIITVGLPSCSVVKNPPANAGDSSSIPGSGRSPGEGNDNPPQYSCLGNPMDREAWWAAVHGIENVRGLNTYSAL